METVCTVNIMYWVLCRPKFVRSTLSELFVVAILLTVAVNFAVFGYVLLFRIIFLLTNLCSICCVSKLENPTLVSTGGADMHNAHV